MAANYVNISPDAIEAQRTALESEKTSFKPRVEFNEKNYLNLRVEPGKNEKIVTVRILPVSATDGRAFFTINTHSLKVSPEISKSGFKSFICLNDENLTEGKDHAECPLCAKSKELYKLADACTDDIEKKALVKEAGQYKAKRTFIVRVIDRAHEDEGVKFWRFNEHRNGDGFYDQLMNLYTIRNNEAVNAGIEGGFNIFDLKHGKDIVITLKYDAVNKKTVSSITDAGFATPLAKTDEQIAEWVNDQKTWRDIYASKSHGYLQIVADGGIPYYDKESSSWKAKNSNESAAVQADYTPQTVVPEATPAALDESDLPF